jgi:hypothetical protein
MLYKVEVRTPQGNLLGLQLDDVSDGFIVQGIDGLDPVKATLVSSDFAQIDGSQYQSARREPRNIVLTIGLDPTDDDSVYDLRNRLYGFLMPKSEISLRFYLLEGLTVDIPGRVESFDAPLFVQEPTATISVINFDPDFYDDTPVVMTGFHTNDVGATTFNYTGTVETGMVFSVAIADTKSDMTIYQTTPSGALQALYVTVPMIAGDVLKVSTVVGDKYVTLTRAGVTTSVLYGLAPQSTWLELEPGNNGIQVYSEGDPSPATITYTTRYGGL